MRAVDLFAGWGGFTLGATMAGAQVAWAANHWPLAVKVHAANHPTTEHVCQDLRQADWTSLPRFDLLLASPACQGHSTASQPKRREYHDAMRSTAHAVVDCVDVTEPRAFIVENVLSFRAWRLYPTWRESLQRCGYTLSEHVVSATEHGVPQRRDRLFIVGLRNGKTLKLPLVLQTEPSFEPCLDPSESDWRHVSQARPGARARIKAALGRFDRCLVQHVTGHQGIPLHESIRTITTKKQWVIAERRDGGRYRWLTPRELARGMGFPDSFTWPIKTSATDAVKGLGNAVCPPVARDLILAVGGAL